MGIFTKTILHNRRRASRLDSRTPEHDRQAAKSAKAPVKTTADDTKRRPEAEEASRGRPHCSTGAAAAESEARSQSSKGRTADTERQTAKDAKTARVWKD